MSACTVYRTANCTTPPTWNIRSACCGLTDQACDHHKETLDEQVTEYLTFAEMVGAPVACPACEGNYTRPIWTKIGDTTTQEAPVSEIENTTTEVIVERGVTKCDMQHDEAGHEAFADGVLSLSCCGKSIASCEACHQEFGMQVAVMVLFGTPGECAVCDAAVLGTEWKEAS